MKVGDEIRNSKELETWVVVIEIAIGIALVSVVIGVIIIVDVRVLPVRVRAARRLLWLYVLFLR